MTDVPTAAPTRTRVDWIDRIRGLALVLMLLDHLLVQVDPDSFLRFTLTRASLPLFMAASAAVWRPGIRPKRLALITAVVVLELLVSPALGMAMPGIMLVYLVAIVPLGNWYRASHHAYAIGALGLVQALYLPVGWAGYEPGLVVLWWCLGRLGSYQLDRLGERLPPALAQVGRHPLGWYAGHLVALVVLVESGVL